ncbi:hypothetical protein QEH56_24510, partial [Pelagicoccus enzymogenes]
RYKEMIKKVFSFLAGKASYRMRYRKLWIELVPSAYEAETLQGELVRCIGNLEDEAKRNGNMNWDSEDRRAVNFLKKHLPDPDVFSEEERKRIKECVKTIGDAGSFKNNEVTDSEEELKYVLNRVVDYCERKPELIYIEEEQEYVGHY